MKSFNTCLFIVENSVGEKEDKFSIKVWLLNYYIDM